MLTCSCCAALILKVRLCQEAADRRAAADGGAPVSNGVRDMVRSRRDGDGEGTPAAERGRGETLDSVDALRQQTQSLWFVPGQYGILTMKQRLADIKYINNTEAQNLSGEHHCHGGNLAKTSVCRNPWQGQL